MKISRELIIEFELKRIKYERIYIGKDMNVGVF